MPDKNNNLFYALNTVIVLIFLSLSGCASISAKREVTEFNSMYTLGDYEGAARYSLEIKENKPDETRLLQLLQAGLAFRYAGEYDKSNELLDRAESVISLYNRQLMKGSRSYVSSLFLNDAILNYRGEEYDGIMLNTYKALNFWKTGNLEYARVEFNRALDRQRRALEHFSKEINEINNSIQKKQITETRNAKNENRDGVEIIKTVENLDFETLSNEKYANLDRYRMYPDFINPFTTYLAALFFKSVGDYEKSSALFKETFGMVSENPVVQDDFFEVEQMLNKQLPEKKHVWVIFENGLGPSKEEFRIDLPVFFFSDSVVYTGIALPKLLEGQSAYDYLTITGNSSIPENTTLLAGMDRVIYTEFQKKYPGIVTRAVLSAILKTYAQKKSQEELGDAGMILAAIYHIATTAADIRIWSALPKEFQIAKLNIPENGILIIETPDGDIRRIQVPENQSSIVYVKIPLRGIDMTVDVIKL